MSFETDSILIAPNAFRFMFFNLQRILYFYNMFLDLNDEIIKITFSIFRATSIVILIASQLQMGRYSCPPACSDATNNTTT